MRKLISPENLFHMLVDEIENWQIENLVKDRDALVAVIEKIKPYAGNDAYKTILENLPKGHCRYCGEEMKLTLWENQYCCENCGSYPDLD